MSLNHCTLPLSGNDTFYLFNGDCSQALWLLFVFRFLEGFVLYLFVLFCLGRMGSLTALLKLKIATNIQALGEFEGV